MYGAELEYVGICRDMEISQGLALGLEGFRFSS